MLCSMLCSKCKCTFSNEIALFIICHISLKIDKVEVRSGEAATQCVAHIFFFFNLWNVATTQCVAITFFFSNLSFETLSVRYGSEQPRIRTQAPGNSLVCSIAHLFAQHCLLCTACLRASLCLFILSLIIYSLTRSLTHWLPSWWENEWLDDSTSGFSEP